MQPARTLRCERMDLILGLECHPSQDDKEAKISASAAPQKYVDPEAVNVNTAVMTILYRIDQVCACLRLEMALIGRRASQSCFGTCGVLPGTHTLLVRRQQWMARARSTRRIRLASILTFVVLWLLLHAQDCSRLATPEAADAPDSLTVPLAVESSSRTFSNLLVVTDLLVQVTCCLLLSPCLTLCELKVWPTALAPPLLVRARLQLLASTHPCAANRSFCPADILRTPLLDLIACCAPTAGLLPVGRGPLGGLRRVARADAHVRAAGGAAPAPRQHPSEYLSLSSSVSAILAVTDLPFSVFAVPRSNPGRRTIFFFLLFCLAAFVSPSCWRLMLIRCVAFVQHLVGWNVDATACGFRGDSADAGESKESDGSGRADMQMRYTSLLNRLISDRPTVRAGRACCPRVEWWLSTPGNCCHCAALVTLCRLERRCHRRCAVLVPAGLAVGALPATLCLLAVRVACALPVIRLLMRVPAGD